MVRASAAMTSERSLSFKKKFDIVPCLAVISTRLYSLLPGGPSSERRNPENLSLFRPTPGRLQRVRAEFCAKRLQLRRYESSHARQSHESLDLGNPVARHEN